MDRPCSECKYKNLEDDPCIHCRDKNLWNPKKLFMVQINEEVKVDMICKKCERDKPPEEFPLEKGKLVRQPNCNVCYKETRRVDCLNRQIKEKDKIIKTLRDLIKDTINACADRNSLMLRMCMERSKREVVRQYPAERKAKNT